MGSRNHRGDVHPFRQFRIYLKGYELRSYLSSRRIPRKKYFFQIRRVFVFQSGKMSVELPKLDYRAGIIHFGSQFVINGEYYISVRCEHFSVYFNIGFVPSDKTSSMCPYDYRIFLFCFQYFWKEYIVCVIPFYRWVSVICNHKRFLFIRGISGRCG